MASLKDVAKLAGVSLMTVSRAINEPGKLRPETYRRVKQAIDQLGYVPDLSRGVFAVTEIACRRSACWRWTPPRRRSRWK